MAVYNWVEKFLQGPWEQEDKGRIGHLVEIVIDMSHEPVGSSDQVDRQVKIDDVADAVRGSHKLAYSIIRDNFHF